MRVLVACEFSGVVRDAFLARGHDAISCDLEATERPGPHYKGDVRDLLSDDWDLMIAHPPCTYLAASGARYWRERQREQQAAIDFVLTLWQAPISRICIENPVGRLATAWRSPDQYIEPWWFGCGETKKTGLWLKNLPPLMSTVVAVERVQRLYYLPQTANRARLRSTTYQGIADAMAYQWGPL